MKNHGKIIEDYLRKKKMSVLDFAALCRISDVTVYNLMHETHKNIHPLTAYKIEQGTKKEIKYEDLTDIPRKKRYIDRFGLKNIPLNY